MTRKATGSRLHRPAPAMRADRKHGPDRILRGLGLLTALLLAAPPAAAQRFGQWWWQGDVGVGQRRTENLRDDALLGRRDQQDLRLSLELNGYLGHPALGSFRLGVDLLLTELDTGGTVDLDSSGFKFNLDALPRSAFPFNLFFNRIQWDYSSDNPDDDETFLFRGSPDTVTRWGGKLRLRKGAFRGLTLGLSRSLLEQLDPEIEDETWEYEFADWARTGRRLDHHLRIERRSQDYALVDLEIENVVINLDERGNLTDNWYWQLSGTGIQRGLSFAANPERKSETYRLRSLLTREIRQRDALDLFTNLAQSDAGGVSSESATVGTAYRWRPARGWQVSPSVSHSQQSTPGSSADGTSGALSVSWTGRKGRFDAVVSGRAGYGRLERQARGRQPTRATQAAFSFNTTLGLGELRRLRKELNLELARGELTQSREPIPELPELGLSGDELSIQDSARVRFGLRHRWDSRFVHGWAEWSTRHSRDGALQSEFDSDTLTATVQIGGRKITLQANATETAATQAATGEQTVRAVGASASWRPWRRLSFRASHRRDSRELFQLPDLEGDRTEVGLRAGLGFLSLSASAFQTNERVVPGLSERTNRGFRWDVRRGFVGWLPIVTGTQRRGVIR